MTVMHRFSTHSQDTPFYYQLIYRSFTAFNCFQLLSTCKLLSTNLNCNQPQSETDFPFRFLSRTTRVLLGILVAPCDTFLKRSRRRPQGLRDFQNYNERKSPPRADDLLDVKMKQTKLDHLMAMLEDPSKMAPRAILSTGAPSTTAAATAAAVAAATSSIPPAPTASVVQKAKKQSSKHEHPKVVNLDGEEGVKEDPSADLQQKRQRRKGKDGDAFDRALGDDFSWKHEVNPIDVAFPEEFNFSRAFDAGLTSASVRESLVTMPPEQLLGESYRYSAKSLVCLQVGVETSLTAKVKAKKELLAALDQIEILKGERDSALACLPLKEKVDSLNDQLSEKTGEYQPA
ncbi:hypothetical protein PIB30_052449 [Stylosanthes scabra]|uniref:Uncharacterized protein n=1 Tax=Stylosanthes scabra TaxID=79078 RepID=A0ABU6YHG1_9FABA|nr:hypothetical protein [Stylosanthes scabra]